jgi:hypothetical protein
MLSVAPLRDRKQEKSREGPIAKRLLTDEGSRIECYPTAKGREKRASDAKEQGTQKASALARGKMRKQAQAN